jgi:hypothetical protein
MQESVTRLFSEPLDSDNPRNDQGALDYISSFAEQVKRSKDPQPYRDLKPRNPIDAFVKWIHAGLDPAAFPYHMQALYAAVGYVPNETEIEPPEKSYSAIYSFKWTFAVHVLRWMVANDPTIDDYHKDRIRNHAPDIGVLAQIEKAF